MGIPGFSGFAAEITILIGAWKAYPVAVWIVGAGMVLVAAFTLRALKRSFFDVRSDELERGAVTMEPITIPEKLGAGLLMFATVGGRTLSENFARSDSTGGRGDALSPMISTAQQSNRLVNAHSVSYLDLLKLACAGSDHRLDRAGGVDHRPDQRSAARFAGRRCRGSEFCSRFGPRLGCRNRRICLAACW